MKFLCYLTILVTAYSCQNKSEIQILECGSNKITLELPPVIDSDNHYFDEGRSIILTTIDSVLIEFYCGGNYSNHISDESRYKILNENNHSFFGADLETGTFWRRDQKLIYSNCKAEDTIAYNRIFNNKIVK